MAGIILLAAGLGSRFIAAGGKGNKLNTILTKTAQSAATLFDLTLRQVLSSGLPVRVVTRAENSQVQASCLREGVPFTLTESAGTGGSVAAGVRDTPDWDGWLVHLADMPFVTPDIFAAVAASLPLKPVVRPYWQNQPGHPVGFARQMRDALLQLHGDHDARELIRSQPLLRLDVTTPAVITDIDLPEQLSLSALFSNGSPHAAS